MTNDFHLDSEGEYEQVAYAKYSFTPFQINQIKQTNKINANYSPDSFLFFVSKNTIYFGSVLASILIGVVGSSGYKIIINTHPYIS